MLKRFLTFLPIAFLFTQFVVSAQNARQQISITNSAKLVSEIFYDEIPFTNKLGYIIIPVKIGTGTYDYIFDTGGFNTVTSEIMESTKLPQLMEVNIGSSNKIKKKIKLSKVPSLQIGKAIFKDVGVFNFDFSDAPVINCYTNGGLIGKSIIREAVWQLDYPKSILRVSDKLESMPFIDEGKTIKIKLDKTLTPFLDLTINGKKETFMLDLGYSGLLSLTEKTVESLNLKNSLIIEGEGDIGANGVVKENTFITKLDHLGIGKIELKDQIAYYSKSNNYNLLGSELGNYFIITLNFKDEELILTPYSNPKNIFETFGFSLNIDDNKVYVSKVFKGLNAQKAGLMINDEIVNMNGKQLNSLSNCERYFYFNNLMKKEEEITVQVKKGESQKDFHIKKQKVF